MENTTTYSQGVAGVCCALVAIYGLIVTVLIFERRDKFPLTVVPFWMQGITLGSVPFAMFGDTSDAMFENPVCIVILGFYYPTFGWIFVAGVLTMMWYVTARYYDQMFRAKLKTPADVLFGTMYAATVKNSRTPKLQFAALCFVLCGPQFMFYAVDYFVEYRDPVIDVYDCRFHWLPAVSCTQTRPVVSLNPNYPPCSWYF